MFEKYRYRCPNCNSITINKMKGRNIHTGKSYVKCKHQTGYACKNCGSHFEHPRDLKVSFGVTL